MVNKEILYKECIGLRNSELLKHLKTEYASTLQMLTTADEATFKSLQGEAQQLERTINMIDNSKSLLERLLNKQVRKRM